MLKSLSKACLLSIRDFGELKWHLPHPGGRGSAEVCSGLKNKRLGSWVLETEGKNRNGQIRRNNSQWEDILEHDLFILKLFDA